MGKIAAGKLNKRVTFERKSTDRDAWGQPLDVWTPVVTVWAHIRTVNGAGFIGQEFEAGGLEVSRALSSIRIRLRTDIEAAMRVLYKGKYYDIKAVLPDEEGDEFVDVAVAVGASEQG